ncbi:MAG: hypothetical protein Kow0059_11590 [Candidatus Sumerlaeia bacterium]
MGWLPIILFTIVGLAVLTALDWPRRELHVLGVLALAWCLGIAVTTLVIMSAAVLTGRMHLWLFWVLVGAGAGWLVLHRRTAMELGTFALIPTGEPLPRREWGRYLYLPACAALAVLIGASVYWVWAVGLSYPLASSDALTNFALRGRLWFDSRELFPRLLLDPEFLMYKRRYPPGVSLIECVWSYVLGGWDGVRLKWIFLNCWAAAGALVFSALLRSSGLLAALLGAAFWAILPFHFTHAAGGAVSGFADIPFSMTLTAGVVTAGLYTPRSSMKFAALTALAMAAPLLIKQEGAVVWGLLFLYMLWRRSDWRHVGLFACLAVYVLALNKLSTRGLPAHFDHDITLSVPLSELLTRAVVMTKLFRKEFFQSLYWGGFVWPAAALLWAFRFWRTPWRRILTLETWMSGALAAVYAVVLLFTARDFEHNFDWAFERLLVHVLPVFYIAMLDGFRLQPAGACTEARHADFDPRAADSGGAGPSGSLPAARAPRPAALTALALACCIVIAVQTRDNHQWSRDRRDSIRKAMKSKDYHPLLLVREEFGMFGRASRMIQDDPAHKYWVAGHVIFYVPLLMNYYLYPGDELRMSVQTQQMTMDAWLKSSDAPVKHLPPHEYEKIIELSYYYSRFIEESEALRLP